MRPLRCLLTAAALSPLCFAQWPNPLPCTGVCNNTQDPALIQRSSDGTWFRFATSKGIPIHTSPNLTGPWTYQGDVLPNGSSIDLPGNDDLWGPDVTLIGDTYYLYYSVSTLASHTSAIGVTTSSVLDSGSWTDHGQIVNSEPGDPFNAIDGNLLLTDDDDALLTFGSYWNGIFQVQLANETKEVDMGKATIDNLAALTGSWLPYIEGAYLFKWDKYYYLFFSVGICCAHNFFVPPPGQEYKIKVCRSTSPSSDFVDQDGTDCLEGGGAEVLGSHDDVYSPGGQGIYNARGGPMLYYHYANPDVGLANEQKLIGMNLLDFSSGWPVVSDKTYTEPALSSNTTQGNGTLGSSGQSSGSRGNGTRAKSGAESLVCGMTMAWRAWYISITLGIWQSLR